MMVLKRKEIIAAALVVLIGMAGYLNWSYQDTVRVKDGESYVETGKKLGEAQYVNATEEAEAPDASPGAEGDKAAETWGKKDESAESKETKETNAQGGDYFEAAKLEKQTARAKSLEILNQTASNESFDTEIRKKAQDQILDTASVVEKETAVENIAKAKGYNNICVYVNEDMADITVKKDGFGDSDVVKLQEIASEQLKMPANSIKIVEVK